MTSVVVPVFNGAHVLAASVPAVLSLCGVDEWVWVDDGSTDGTSDLLDSLLADEPRARIVRHDANRGRAAARNTGVATTACDVLVFFDADVAPEPDMAECFVSVLDAGATATVARFVSTEFADDPYGVYLRRARRGVPPGARLGDPLPWRVFLAGASAVRRDALKRAGGFDTGVAYGEDLALATRLATDAPDGLRASGATVTLSDTGTLARALANIDRFGRALPGLEKRSRGVLSVGGLEGVLRPGLRHAVASSRVLGQAVRWLAPRLPAAMQPVAVRYLLGHTLVRAYDDARLHPRTGR